MKRYRILAYCERCMHVGSIGCHGSFKFTSIHTSLTLRKHSLVLRLYIQGSRHSCLNLRLIIGGLASDNSLVVDDSSNNAKWVEVVSSHQIYCIQIFTIQ